MNAQQAQSMGTRQGNRLGRSAVIEAKSAALSGEFGKQMLSAKFAKDADAIMAKLGVYSRGPRKGMQRGYVHWEKVIEGGFDYRSNRRYVVLPGTQDWSVRADANPLSTDILTQIDREREAAIEASPVAKLVQRAFRIRAMAVDDLDSYNRLRALGIAELTEECLSDFHSRMGRAKKLIIEARDLANAA